MAAVLQRVSHRGSRGAASSDTSIQGGRPYLEIIERYPDIRAMAEADVTSLREWFRPLGLTNRARSLIQTAQAILERYDGEVPKDLSAIESLPGLGRTVPARFLV